MRLVLTSDDPNFPAMMTFRHASAGTSSLNRVAATSRLLLPLAAGTPYYRIVRAAVGSVSVR